MGIPVAFGVLILSVCVVSCGDEAKDKTQKGPDPSGTWLGCVDDDGDSSSTEFEFSGTDLTQVYLSFSGAGCDSENQRYATELKATYALIQAEPHPAGAYLLSATFSNAFISFSSETQVESANSVTICELSDWQIDVQRSVKDIDCSEESGFSELADFVGKTRGLYYQIEGDELKVVDQTTNTFGSALKKQD